MNGLIEFLRLRVEDAEWGACCGDESCVDACECLDHNCDMKAVRRLLLGVTELLDAAEDAELASRDRQADDEEIALGTWITDVAMPRMAAPHDDHKYFREEWRR